MNKYEKLLSKLKVVGSSMPFGKPLYFDAAERYLEAITPSEGRPINQGLWNLASEERKLMMRAFSVTGQDFRFFFLNYRVDDRPLHVLLETIFEYNMLHDAEVLKRYIELKEVASRFKEVLPNVYLCETSNHVYAAFVREGKFFKYSKRHDFVKCVVEDEDIYLVYRNGQIDCICEDGSFSDDCTVAEVVIDKDYSRVSIGSHFFRAHTLLLALTYGVDLVKHTLGRYSLLTVDHINKVSSDNELRNLRVITRLDNTYLKTNRQHDAYDFFQMDSFRKKRLRTYSGFIVTDPAFMY